jgi:CheY-like chemotaxis protein
MPHPPSPPLQREGGRMNLTGSALVFGGRYGLACFIASPPYNSFGAYPSDKVYWCGWWAEPHLFVPCLEKTANRRSATTCMPTIKVALADDNEHFREAVRVLLEREPTMEIVLEAKNGKQLIDQLPLHMPDIVLMDIQMPVMDGIEATQHLMATYPHLKIIALSMFDNELNIIKMSALGIKSFIGKDDATVLPKAITIVHEGGVYLPNEVALNYKRT